MRQHRHATGTDAHVTADRSDGPGRRRKRKPIAEGGTSPHMGTCELCGAHVIWHRRPGAVPTVKLDREPVPAERVHPDSAPRFIIFQGAALMDTDPRNVPEGMPFYREHRCPAPPEP